MNDRMDTPRIPEQERRSRDVLDTVSKLSGYTHEELRSGDRISVRMSEFRLLGYWMSVKRGVNYTRTGLIWGKTHHTVISGVKKFTAALDSGARWAVKRRDDFNSLRSSGGDPAASPHYFDTGSDSCERK